MEALSTDCYGEGNGAPSEKVQRQKKMGETVVALHRSSGACDPGQARARSSPESGVGGKSPFHVASSGMQGKKFMLLKWRFAIPRPCQAVGPATARTTKEQQRGLSGDPAGCSAGFLRALHRSILLPSDTYAARKFHLAFSAPNDYPLLPLLDLSPSLSIYLSVYAPRCQFLFRCNFFRVRYYSVLLSFSSLL